jgi:PEP-CTERM motif
MKCIMRVAVCIITLQFFSGLVTSDAAATQVTLNFVQSTSTMTWGGFFGGQPFLAQSAPGTTDFNPLLPSNTTTHQGTITVDVDNLLLPSSIQILSSNADSDLSGKWLPDNYSFLPNDVDGDLNLYEFPDDASSSVGTVPGPAADADFAIEISPGVDVAYAALRDMVFNITTAPGVPVNALGQFDSKTENIEYLTGWWDYWLHPTFTAEKLRQRLEVAGGDNDNFNDFAAGTAPSSTYVAVPLGGGAYQITLTIPVNALDPDDTAPTRFTGTLVATTIIPEPASLLLFGLGGMLINLFTVRRRG